MIWVALVFSCGVVAYGFHQDVTVREWFVMATLLSFTLLGAILVSWDIWPKLDLLVWVRNLFEPATKWLYSVV